MWRGGRAIARTGANAAEAEHGRAALWLPVFMGVGVLVYYGLHDEPPAWAGAKFAAAGFAAALASGRHRVVQAAAFAAAFTALGFASAQHATSRLPPIESNLPSRAVMAAGIVRAVETLPHTRRITLKAVVVGNDEPPPGRSRAKAKFPPEPDRALVRMIRIRLKAGDTTVVATGDSIRVRAMLRPPSAPAWPGGWDTQRDAFHSGLGAYGHALSEIKVTGRGAPDAFASHIQWLRETIAARITAVIPGAAGAVAVTLLTGAARGIPEADHAAFRDSGLAHLLAVAGLHIGIVMGFVLAASRAAFALSERASLRWPIRKITAVIALSAGGAYMLLTGSHVPIMRSFAMACLFTVALLAGRQPVSLRGLAVAGIALMLIAPYEVPGVSFQMSFSAVLALIAGYEALRPVLRRLHGKSMARKVGWHIVTLALTSTLAGTASLPYGAYHFGHVQLYYIQSNMLAVPLTAFWVMPAGMIALVLMPFGLEWLALVPMGWGASIIIVIARLTASLPAATLAVPHIPPWGLALLSLGIAWLGIWRTRIRLGGLALIAIGLMSPAFDRAPDILVSADAGLIGFRTSDGVFLQQTSGASGFVRDSWLSRWSVTTSTPMPPEGWAGKGTLTCVRDACVFRPRPDQMAALLIRGPSKPSGCGGAAVLVSAEPARGICAYPPPRPVDRFTVWKEGPVAIWLEPTGARVLTDRQNRGTRPWVPPPPKPRKRPPSQLPMAQLDRLANNAATVPPAALEP